jgi:hypothetical protein
VFPGLPKRNPGLEFANAFSVKEMDFAIQPPKVSKQLTLRAVKNGMQTIVADENHYEGEEI